MEHSTYQKWKTSNGDDLLWLSADPGCGKSVLSRALIDEKLVSTETSTICYFFFKDNDEQNNTAAAICALLHQLFRAHPCLFERHAASALKECGQSLKKEFEELWRILISASSDPSAGDIVCILDALDECQQSDRDKLIAQLEQFYRTSLGQVKPKTRLKFLVTSRPYFEIECRFRSLTSRVPTIRLAGEDESERISHEIGIFIKSKIKQLGEELGLSEQVQSSLQKRLSQVPQRTYLWLRLIFEEIENALSWVEPTLLRIIDQLPLTIEKAYENLLGKCKFKEKARLVLQIIVAAARPLTLSEMDIALAIASRPESRSYEDLTDREFEHREIQIRNLCGLFVTIVDSRIYLIHQTAKEFLLGKKDEADSAQGWRHSIDLRQSHQVLAEICVAHLSFREFKGRSHRCFSVTERFPTRRSIKAYRRYPFLEHPADVCWRYPFLDYSANQWITHVQMTNLNASSWVYRTAQLCDIGDPRFSTWLNVYNYSNHDFHIEELLDPSIPPENKSALYWSAIFGLKNETQFLLDSGMNPNVEDGSYRSALRAACTQGHIAVLEILLYVSISSLNII